jgi:hypothetical protein
MWFASLTLSLLGSSSWLKQERLFYGKEELPD